MITLCNKYVGKNNDSINMIHLLNKYVGANTDDMNTITIYTINIDDIHMINIPIEYVRANIDDINNKKFKKNTSKDEFNIKPYYKIFLRILN